MNQISVMNLRENQILAGASMEYVVGGKHTGDATTCPHCGPDLPGTDMVRDWPIMGTIITGVVMGRCWLKKKLS